MTAGAASGTRAPGRTIVALTGVTIAAVVVAVASGAVAVTPGEVVATLVHRLLGVGAAPDPLVASVVLEVRIPRVATVALVGAALALAGAALQGMLGNPLAEPGVLGLSAVAALAAVGVLALAGPTAPGLLVVTVAAIATGAASVLLVRIARRDGRIEVTTIVLAGVALQAAAVAALTAVLTASADPGLRTVAFWTFGSAGAARPMTALTVLAVVVAAGVLLRSLAPALDLLALGDRTAAHLGVDVARTRRIVHVAVALLVAVSVTAVGIVAFVGLLVPHAVRRLTGPAHRTLLPASALAGATLLVLTDLVARTLFLPRELPLGTLTALLGAPLLLLLLRGARDRQGGWV